MKRRDEWEWGEIAMLTGAFVLVATVVYLVAWAIWYEIKHPCVKWETHACEETYCSAWASIPHTVTNGKTTTTTFSQTCIVWSTRQTTCSTCVERQ